ncbi:hypothetical protein RHSIM_Rhsim05G0158000 [Rhododendron simsii]|uniref:Uncharacterized protein n=1 Tax=Rhododendron simsii TaxID=118357 RepID=A0A834H218_RHOSS|nr:hypothetical protein RHSIM_Rhsim05G0158000 [Rhododendron simsii]
MAEAILGIIAKKATEIAASRIIQESSRLSHVREALEWIETEMRRIQSYLEDAEAKQLRTKGVSNFIRDIWDLAYDVEDIIDIYFPRIRLSRSRWKRLLDFSNMRTARNFVKKVERIKERVEDITIARLTFGINESSCSSEEDALDPRQSFPHPDEPNIVGFDDLIKNLVDKVLNEDLHYRVVSITGFAGLGKTTLARKVYNSARQSRVHYFSRQHFDCAAWICVSQIPNTKKLLRDIARQVGLEEKKIEDDVVTNLYKFLSTKRYVIVIDDIWCTKAWDALMLGLPMNSKNGSRLILTSRNRDVDPPQLENIGEQILKRCGGVPLANVLAAGLLKLRERSETEWKGVLEDMGQDNDQCKIFASSYNDLPTKLKPCFLYFGLFLEDSEIRVFELINLWTAEGFINGERVREVEEVGYGYLNCLIARNLIQVAQRKLNGTVLTVRIHDILHNLCIRVGKEINFFNIHTNEINCNNALKVHRVTVHGNDMTAALLCIQKLLAFVLCYVLFVGTHGILRLIKIFYATRNFFECLVLRTAMYRELPYAISNLKSLLTLDVRESVKVYLPNVIWSMKQLRHILLPVRCYAPSFWGVDLDVFHRVEISFPNLQTLHWLPSDLFKIDWLHKLTGLRTLRVNLENKDIIGVLSDVTPVSHKLEELSLVASVLDLRETISLNFSRYCNLSELFIENVRLNELLHDKLPPNLTTLSLVRTHLMTNTAEALKKLRMLKFLKLGSHSYSGKELVFSGEHGHFPELLVLEIEYLPNLEMVVVEEGGMPRLRDFRILGCCPETRIPDRVRSVMIRTIE